MPIGTTNFPTSLDDNTSLIAATNAASTTLNGAHNNSITTITVASTTLFPSSGIILVDSELISYTGKTSTTFTGCTRALESTTAASHSNGAAVAFVYTAKMRQVLIDALIAIETKLGTGATTIPTALAAKQDSLGFTAVPNTRTVAGHPLSADVVIAGADLTMADVTTNNASTSAHGFLKKLSNNASEFMNGQGNWVAPSGSGDMVLANVQSVTGEKTFTDTKLKLAGGAYGALDASLPAVVAKTFIFNTDSGRLFFGKNDASAWAEILLAGTSTPIGVAAGGTGVATLSGIPKFSGTSAVTAAKEVWSWALSDESTSITTGVKVTDRAPHAFTITEVRISLTTASTSGLVTLNIKKNGTTIFTTQVSIDANEKTSTTAAIPAVLSTTSIADDDELTFDVTDAGTGAKGLKVRIIGHQ